MPNDFVPYGARTFEAIVGAIRRRVNVLFSGVAAPIAGGVFDTLIRAFAGIADMLGYYIDATFREGFISFAQRESSLIAHAEARGISINGIMPNVQEIRVFNYVTGNEEDDANAGLTRADVSTIIDSAPTSQRGVEEVVLRRGASFEQGGIRFFTIRDFQILKDLEAYTSSGIMAQSDDDFANTLESIRGRDNVLEVVGGRVLPDVAFGGVNQPAIENGQIILPQPVISYEQISISIAGETWSYVSSFRDAGLNDNFFSVRYIGNGQSAIIFGDGIKGRSPSSGIGTITGLISNDETAQLMPGQSVSLVTGRFDLGINEDGDLGSTSISSILFPNDEQNRFFSLDINRNLTMGGIHDPSLETIRTSIQNSIQTNERIITRADFVSALEGDARVQKAIVTSSGNTFRGNVLRQGEIIQGTTPATRYLDYRNNFTTGQAENINSELALRRVLGISLDTRQVRLLHYNVLVEIENNRITGTSRTAIDAALRQEYDNEFSNFRNIEGRERVEISRLISFFQSIAGVNRVVSLRTRIAPLLFQTAGEAYNVNALLLDNADNSLTNTLSNIEGDATRTSEISVTSNGLQIETGGSTSSFISVPADAETIITGTHTTSPDIFYRLDTRFARDADMIWEVTQFSDDYQERVEGDVLLYSSWRHVSLAPISVEN